MPSVSFTKTFSLWIGLALLGTCGKDKDVANKTSGQDDKSSELTASLGPDLTFTADASTLSSSLLLSPSGDGVALYAKDGVSWRFDFSEKRWRGQDQLIGSEGQRFNVEDKYFWLLETEKIHVASSKALSDAKIVNVAFALQDYRLIHLSLRGAFFAKSDSTEIIWLLQSEDLKFEELKMSWSPEDGEVYSIFFLAEDEFGIASDKLIKKVSYKDGTIAVKAKVSFNIEGLSGSLKSLYLAGSATESNLNLDKVIALTDQGLDSSLYPISTDQNNGEILSWTAVRPLVEQYCVRCHFPGSGRVWENAGDEAAWKQRKDTIVHQLTNGIMPPSSDATAGAIKDEERAILINWAKQQN